MSVTVLLRQHFVFVVLSLASVGSLTSRGTMHAGLICSNGPTPGLPLIIAQTCKNCLVVGATQLSDPLFRQMKPLVDQGYHCRYSRSGCCASNPLTCVQTSETNSPCCALSLLTKMSLPCCPTAFTCSTCSVASGNIRDPYNVASFSGRGTSFDDGRIKPDLVAPGEDILSAAAPGADSNGSLIPTQPNYCGVPSPTTARTLTESQNVAVSLKSGTSMATPLVAGAVEKIRQYFKQGYYPSGTPGGPSINPDESLLRAVILASAKPLSGSGGVWNKLPFQSDFSRYRIPVNSQIPDVFAGFGMPILDNAVSMPDGIYKMFFTSETFQASSGPSAFAIPCDNQSSTPVTIVLAWTDPPGSTSSKKQLVNDLDLIVLVPSSTSSSAQLFGNMRDFADSSNVVERVICACPAGGSLTAIVLPGEAIKTAAQKWNLVANGPISSSITKLESVPIFKAGRIAAPATTPASCVSSSRLSYSLYFVPGREWLVPSSSWEMQRLLLEFSVSLSIFARVNRQAISISLTLPCLDCSPSFATLSLGCSTLITMSSSGLISFEYITASALYSALRTNCDDSESPCQMDPILSAFDWTEFAAAPHFCNSYVTCGTCTSAAACGWCASRGTCKSGNALGSDDGRCASLSTWNWNSSACSRPAPPPPTPDAQMAVFVFRIADRSIESWTGANTQQFENEMQSLLKDSTNIFKVTKIRSGSVILDSQVSTTASMLPAINTVFTNLDLLRQLPAYGSSLSVVAVPPQSACSGFTALETCVASSACGWCSVVESCLPGSKDGATVPPGSDSTCTGDNWKFEISHSCASLYIVGTACIGIPAAALYAIVAVAVVHVVQALLFVYLGKKRGFFSSGKCFLACLLPVIGWGVWCFIRKKEQPHNAEGPGNSLVEIPRVTNSAR